MSTLVEQFHFLRPAWLLVIPLSFLIWRLAVRQEDARRRWSGIIAPHLLEVLLVGRATGWRWRPIHHVMLMLVLGALGLAGPTWERELPPFTEDRAPLVVVLDLSNSMNAIDVQPTRLERAKQKIRDLLARRVGSRTALFVYAASAHMVLPLTDDPALMEIFLASLSTDLMPREGKNAGAALEAAEQLLAREEAPGTILFLTDGIEQKDRSAFVSHGVRSSDQIMVLGVGTAAGGPIRSGENRFLTDSTGRRIVTRMDVEGFERLRDEAGIEVAAVTLDSEDVEWVQRRAQSHLELVQQQSGEERWVDFGYFLTIPVVLLAAIWFRRGWTVRWQPAR